MDSTPKISQVSWHIGTSSVVTYCWSKRSIPFTFWPRSCHQVVVRQDHRSHGDPCPRPPAQRCPAPSKQIWRSPASGAPGSAGPWQLVLQKGNGDITALLFFTSFQTSCGQLPVNNRLCLVLPGTQLMPTSTVSPAHRIQRKLELLVKFPSMLPTSISPNRTHLWGQWRHES